MKITHAQPGERMPWSPTVVHVERMRKRRLSKSRVIILIVALVLVGGCLAAWLTVKPMGASTAARFTPTPTRYVTRTPWYSTPIPGWTPVPGMGGIVVYKVEPLKR